MTPEELTNAQGQLAQIDTELAAIDQGIRDCITRSQEFNAARRVKQAQRTELEKASEPLRQAVAAQVADNKRAAAEKAKQEAASKPAEPNPLEVLQAQVTKLTALLEAKNG